MSLQNSSCPLRCRLLIVKHLFSSKVLCKFLILALACSSLTSRAGIFDDGVFKKLHVGEFIYEISAHEIKRVGLNGDTTTVQLPYATNAMLRYFRPSMEKEFSYTVDTGIGSVFLEGNRIWFGLDFYSGEGSAGIGGIGFLDTRTMRIGLLRHPALVDCAIDNIVVTTDEIIVDTYYFGEYAQGPCSGRVAIDRHSLTAWFCTENRKAIQNKKDTTIYSPSKTQNNSKTLMCPSKKPGPSIKVLLRKRFESVGLERYMLERTDFEHHWFAEAAQHGEIILDQRCTIAPAKNHRTATCTTAPVNEHGIKSLALQGLGNYKCQPDGFDAMDVITREAVSNGVEARAYPKDRLRYVYNNHEVAQRYPIVAAGMIWTKYTYGVLDKLTLEGVEIVNSVCSEPYQWISGPAIRTANFWLRVLKVDQGYRPADLK